MRDYEDEAQCDSNLSPSPLLKHYPQLNNGAMSKAVFWKGTAPKSCMVIQWPALTGGADGQGCAGARRGQPTSTVTTSTTAGLREVFVRMRVLLPALVGFEHGIGHVRSLSIMGVAPNPYGLSA